ncbi:MAG: cbb3-type cytochrome c oxidase subunit 3 [Alphaproteobacteria bacterium]
MSETYSALAHFAQSWGLLYFFVVFVGVVAFVMWPSRRRRYDDAGNIPLQED